MASDSHGGTAAAWTAVAIIILGSLISGVALPLRSPFLFFVGFVVIALGAVVGKVMSMMGMGSTVAYTDERDPDYASGDTDDAASTDASTDASPDAAADRPAATPAATPTETLGRPRQDQEQ